MGRKKIKIARFATEVERKVVYCRRRKAVLKKANEISILCDIEVLVLMFSPSGELDHFSSQPGKWKILERFIQKVRSMSDTERENLLVSQISSDVVHDKIELMLLQLQNKMMHPSREAFISEEKFKKLTQGLAKVHHMIAQRREKLEAQQHSLNISDDSTRSTQNSERHILVRQQREGVEAGMGGLPQGGENMQQSVHSNMPIEQLSAAPEDGILDPLQEEQNVQLSSPSLSAYQLQSPPEYETWDPVLREENTQVQGVSGAQQNIHTPKSKSKEIKLEVVLDLSLSPDDVTKWLKSATNSSRKRDRSN